MSSELFALATNTLAVRRHPNEPLADYARRLRESAGISQEALAQALGVTTKTVYRIESEGKIGTKSGKAYARYFQVPVDDLLGDGEVAPTETTYEPIDGESLSDEDYAIEGVRRDLGPLEAAEVEFLRSEFQAVQFSVGRLETEMAIARLKSKLREYRGKLPLPERERVEEPKASGESIRGVVLGKKPKR